MIDASGIRKRYGTLEVLKGVDLHVAKGEIVSIVGASGAGKTTLLQILGTLERADGGSLRIAGEELLGMGSAALSAFRNRHIGFVFQFHQLLPEFTALENVLMPGLIAGKSQNECRPRAEELLTRLNVIARKEHKPSQLSGGEQQRVAVARALANRPSLVLADEPTGALDYVNAQQVLDLIRKLCEEVRASLLIVTHDRSIAAQLSRTVDLYEINRAATRPLNFAGATQEAGR